jgi:acetyl esterase/lipase
MGSRAGRIRKSSHPLPARWRVFDVRPQYPPVVGHPSVEGRGCPRDPARKLKYRNARKCSMFTRGALSMFAQYLSKAHLPGDGGDHEGRFVSPVDADLSSLPPVTIHASSDELLLPEAELMAQRLEAVRVRCDLHLWDKQVHDFPMAADVLPEGRRAIRYIGEFVKRVTAAGEAVSWRPVTAAAV